MYSDPIQINLPSNETSLDYQINRLETAKSDIKTAIEAKGVTVGDGTIDTYASKITQIPTGGSYNAYTVKTIAERDALTGVQDGDICTVTEVKVGVSENTYLNLSTVYLPNEIHFPQKLPAEYFSISYYDTTQYTNDVFDVSATVWTPEEGEEGEEGEALVEYIDVTWSPMGQESGSIKYLTNDGINYTASPAMTEEWKEVYFPDNATTQTDWSPWNDAYSHIIYIPAPAAVYKVVVSSGTVEWTAI